jgi:hypothetical protein
MHAPTPAPSNAHRLRPGALAGAALLTVLVGLGACGDDGDDTAGGTTTAPPTTVEAASDTEAPALCDAWLATDEAGSALGGPDVDPEVAAQATQAIADALEGVEAPEGLDQQLQTADDAVADALAGDPAAFESPEFTAAITDIGSWVHEDCGFASVEVDAVDHAFEGLDDSLPVGPASFRLTNGGADAHVMVIHRFDDDSELSADDLVAAMEPMGSTALDDETEPTVTGAFAAPGGVGYVTADLAAGRYVVFCPIPTGFTGDGPPPADALPHVAQGMYAEFTVA